jgi:hypothetical protein
MTFFFSASAWNVSYPGDREPHSLDFLKPWKPSNNNIIYAVMWNLGWAVWKDEEVVVLKNWMHWVVSRSIELAIAE